MHQIDIENIDLSKLIDMFEEKESHDHTIAVYPAKEDERNVFVIEYKHDTDMVSLVFFFDKEYIEFITELDAGIKIKVTTPFLSNSKIDVFNSAIRGDKNTIGYLYSTIVNRHELMYAINKALIFTHQLFNKNTDSDIDEIVSSTKHNDYTIESIIDKKTSTMFKNKKFINNAIVGLFNQISVTHAMRIKIFTHSNEIKKEQNETSI